MKKAIAMVTCDDKLAGTIDDRIFYDAVQARGHKVCFCSWTDESIDWSKYDLVLIRSTWDYYRKIPAYLDWAKRVSSLTNLVNPLAVILWNSSKNYLLHLEKNGIPIVPTIVTGSFQDAYKAADDLIAIHQKIVVKPAISAAADLTYLVCHIENLPSAILKILERGQVLLQPYFEAVCISGEVSLMFFGKENSFQYSHAVLKKPKPDDFRVQVDFGGTVEGIKAPGSLIELARKALAKSPFPVSYARVDIIDWESNPKIAELELIEPELFFRFSPRAADDFASALNL